jgi:hypothetical protein
LPSWAPEIVEGAVLLIDPSKKQVAAMLGISTTYLDAALKIGTHRRTAVRGGLLPLIEPHAKVSPHGG